MTSTERIFGLDNSLQRLKELKDNITHDMYVKIKQNLAMPAQNHFAMHEMIKEAIANLADCSSHYALDEMLNKFYGRFEFIHHMPQKPAKIGIKTFIIACSLFKIPFDFVFHDQDMPETDGMNKIDGMVFDVIQRNLKTLLIKEGSTLFTDNYFTTHNLMKRLAAIKINFVGTAKTQLIPGPVKEMPEVLEFAKKAKRVYDLSLIHI